MRYRLELRASEAIKAGGEIVNQYVKPNSGTVSRRLILKNKWHFECDCRRCKDPTEFGSLLSALTCEKVILKYVVNSFDYYLLQMLTFVHIINLCLHFSALMRYFQSSQRR